jgi:molecular chaperone DnaJ
MALKYHPDRNPNVKNPEEAFSKINHAYKVLSEFVQSAEYDPSVGSYSQDERERWGEENTQPGVKKTSKVKTHYKYSLLLTLEECAIGCSKVIHFYRTSPLGKKEEVRLEVTIPKGVKEGQKLKLKGEGPVLQDGNKGDLFIYIDVLPHPIFERKGRNVYMDLPISISTAILGGKVSIPTLSGKANLTIPPDTHSGRVFRLKQKGFSHVNSNTSGDMLIKVVVDFPENLNEEELQALKVLSSKTPPLVKEYNLKLQDCLQNRKR